MRDLVILDDEVRESHVVTVFVHRLFAAHLELVAHRQLVRALHSSCFAAREAESRNLLACRVEIKVLAEVADRLDHVGVLLDARVRWLRVHEPFEREVD